MDISTISQYHKLNPLQVSSEQLLLDPRNPRINVDIEERDELSNSELLSEELQLDILRKINKNEHHVSELIKDISKSGFVNGLGPFIVKRISGSNKYLVIEGNRRTTAIKHLKRESNGLSPGIVESLEQIHVEELEYLENDEFTEAEIIDILLGAIHIKGPLSWGAMEKAHYVYNNYMRQYTKHFQGSRFEFNPDCLERVCDMFPYSQNDVKKSLMIYRIYLQLKQAGYTVKTDRFTLIESAVSDAGLRDGYFEFEETQFVFSECGLDKLYNLCIKDDRIIRNPKDFNRFKKIYVFGSDEDVNAIENEIDSIEDIYADIQDDVRQGKALSKLEDILKKLNTLNLTLVKDDECVGVAKSIVGLVNDKLAPLLGGAILKQTNSTMISSNTVHHDEFGKGIVMEIDLLGKRVYIDFDERGNKVLSLDYVMQKML